MFWDHQRLCVKVCVVKATDRSRSSWCWNADKIIASSAVRLASVISAERLSAPTRGMPRCDELFCCRLELWIGSQEAFFGHQIRREWMRSISNPWFTRDKRSYTWWEESHFGPNREREGHRTTMDGNNNNHTNQESHTDTSRDNTKRRQEIEDFDVEDYFARSRARRMRRKINFFRGKHLHACPFLWFRQNRSNEKWCHK